MTHHKSISIYGYGIKANTDWKQTWAVNGDSMKPSLNNNRRLIWCHLECQKFASDELYSIDSWQKVMVARLMWRHPDETPEQVAATKLSVLC